MPSGIGFALQRFSSGLLRALLGLACLAASGCVGVATVLTDDQAPDDWLNPASWIAWLIGNPPRAGLMVLTALGVGASLWLSIFQVFYSKAAKRSADRIARLIADSESRMTDAVRDEGAKSADRDADLSAEVALMRRQLAEFMAASRRPVEPEAAQAIDTALSRVSRSTAPDLESAREALREQDPEGLVDALMASTSREAAERFREAGAIAYAFNVEKAFTAYSRAALVDPGDVWTHIFLTRLARRSGDLAAARIHAEVALAATSDDRDRSCSLDELGDVARQEGDLPAARKAYEDSLKIRKALADRDPKNTDWQRDLSVSYERLGNVARQEGDLPAARKAYEDSLVIAKALADRDPKNTDWQRDLSVSYERLGDLAEARDETREALALYELSRPIAETLAAKDRTNAEFQNDIAITKRRIEALRGKLA